MPVFLSRTRTFWPVHRERSPCPWPIFDAIGTSGERKAELQRFSELGPAIEQEHVVPELFGHPERPSGPRDLLPARRCRLMRERWQQHKSHTSAVLALGDQIQPSILLKKISVKRSWQSPVQADSAANNLPPFPEHYTRMARGIRSELFRNSHAREAKELSIQASSTATDFSELSVL